MTPGPFEEAGQTARSLIVALTASPGLMVLAIMNIIIMIVLYLGISGERENKNEIEKMLIAQCGPKT